MATSSVESTRFNDLCRLCATKTNMLLGINIFETEGTERQILKKIKSLLPVQIHENDELPKMICDSCLYKLELLSDFHDRSLRVEGLLVDLFKELNTIQLQEQIKQNIQLDHHGLIMVQQQNTLLNDNSMHHIGEIDLGQLTQRDGMIVEHEIILAHQNVTLDSIELTNHELNQELSNHSIQTGDNILMNEAHLQNERFGSSNLDYHADHQMLSEEYALSDINLTDNNLQAQNSIKNGVQLEEPCTRHSDRDNKENIVIVQDDLLKQEDSNSDHALMIHEKEPFLLASSTIQNNVSNSNMDSVESEKQWLFCNLCGKTFQDKILFNEHYDEHFNKCNICFAVFVNAETLNAHRKEMHGNRVEEDDKSEVTSKDDNEITDGEVLAQTEIAEEDDIPEEESPENVPTKKKKCSPKVCKECGKSYKTNYKLAEHMRKHTGEQPFKCRSCDKAFRSKIGLAQHEAKHTGQYDYACITCGKGFQCKSYLMVHQRVHSDLKPFPCTTCGRNFKTKQSLLDHTNRHLGVKPYMCEICGRSFITNGLCKAHQKIHSGADNRKYSCVVCNKRFVSKSYLQTHLRIHTGEKPFMCEVCGKGFLTRVDLKIHSTLHTGEKSYVCEICGKAFARRDALRCHRRSHTGERPYSCDICGQTFTQFSPMAIHKRLHTGERPYECETCGKKFVSKSTMMVHSKKHVR